MFNNALVKEVEKTTGFKLIKFDCGYNYEFIYRENTRPLLGLVIELKPDDPIYFLRNVVWKPEEWDFISQENVNNLWRDLGRYIQLYDITMNKLKPIIKKYKLNLL